MDYNVQEGTVVLEAPTRLDDGGREKEDREYAPVRREDDHETGHDPAAGGHGCRPGEEDAAPPITRFVMFCAFCASLNSANLGYDIGVSGGAFFIAKGDLSLSEVETEVLVLMLIQYGSSHGAKDMNHTLLSMAGVDWFAKRNGSAGRGVQPVFLCPNALHLPLPPRLFS